MPFKTFKQPAFEWRVSDNTDESLLEKIINKNNLRAISLLEKAVQVSRAVARISLAGGVATGFLVAKDMLLTNNHVFGNKADARGATIEMNYQRGLLGDMLPTDSYECDPNSYFKTNVGLDYALVRVKGDPGLKWGYLGLNIPHHPVEVRDDLFIIQHPAGEHKQVGLSDNVLAYVDEKLLQYVTDTLPGSSGSPVFNDHFELVGLHHSGGDLQEPGGSVHYRNEAIRITAVAAHIGTS